MAEARIPDVAFFYATVQWGLRALHISYLPSFLG